MQAVCTKWGFRVVQFNDVILIYPSTDPCCHGSQSVVLRDKSGLYLACIGNVFEVFIHCVSKNIPNIFDCNLKTNYHILITFGTNIPDTTCHQVTAQFSTSPSICFCATWGKHNQRNITFLSNAI